MTKQGRYRVKVSRRARDALLKLTKKLQRRLITAMQNLAHDPRPARCKKLAGQGSMYRIRLGTYRIVYQIQDDELLVLVLRIGHRSEIYRRL
ncbi:MAG: type II toxin-antitoxin system RelE/ParE family toxin [Phycisphaerae bacterium]|nr:type II toxin-antitoxin system RelE/ParE family toxin [Phycisphaerae bacterium]